MFTVRLCRLRPFGSRKANEEQAWIPLNLAVKGFLIPAWLLGPYLPIRSVWRIAEVYDQTIEPEEILQAVMCVEMQMQSRTLGMRPYGGPVYGRSSRKPDMDHQNKPDKFSWFKFYRVRRPTG